MYPRETQEFSLERLDSRAEPDEDISRFFVETNVFTIDELYNNNISSDAYNIIFQSDFRIFSKFENKLSSNSIDQTIATGMDKTIATDIDIDKTIAATDSKEIVKNPKKDSHPDELRSCEVKVTAIKPCRGSAASTKRKSYKRKKIITESTPKLPAMPESTKDFVIVRARRGQATDRHSIAERVRREKIRKRMDYLQDLVPGCCKAATKIVMFDEIINYIKSLQNQVEVLAMKLCAESLQPVNEDLWGTAECDGEVQS